MQYGVTHFCSSPTQGDVIYIVGSAESHPKFQLFQPSRSTGVRFIEKDPSILRFRRMSDTQKFLESCLGDLLRFHVSRQLTRATATKRLSRNMLAACIWKLGCGQNEERACNLRRELDL